MARILGILAILICTSEAFAAKPNYYYNSRGRYLGRSSTHGSTTYYYDSRGYSLGRSRISGTGRTYYYDGRGYSRGSSSGPSKSFYNLYR